MEWVKSEDQFIRDHYFNLGARRCGALLNRSDSSIHKRAHRLKVSGSKNIGSGFLDRNKPTLLYLVSFNCTGNRIYKLGITNNTPRERYQDLYTKLKMKTEWIVQFDTGHKAFAAEQRLLDRYSFAKINTGLLKDGNTETLTCYVDKPQRK